MWVNFETSQLETIKAAMAALAADDKRAAELFWNDKIPDVKATREACLARAQDYESIANAIDKALSDFDGDDPFRAAAKEQANDELEIDDDAVVSEGSDPGAWVHAWIWITNSEAGIPDDDGDEDENTCRTCGESYADGGDGFDGECPSCADKTDQKLHPENYV